MLLATAAAGCLSRPVEESDLPVLVTVADLAPYGYAVAGHQRFESLSRTVFADRSLQLDYEYDAPDGQGRPLYLSASATYEPSARAASATLRLERAAFSTVAELWDLVLRPDERFYRFGDESYFAHLERDRRRLGHLFQARVGRRTYWLVVTGLVFDQPDDWAGLLDPKLDYFRRYDPWSRRVQAAGPSRAALSP